MCCSWGTGNPGEPREAKGGRQELMKNVCQRVEQASKTGAHLHREANGGRCLLERQGAGGHQRLKSQGEVWNKLSRPF